MKQRNPWRIAKAAVLVLAWLVTISCLCGLGLLLATGCVPTRPAYRFKPAPSYLPGPKPYVHERYPNHP